MTFDEWWREVQQRAIRESREWTLGSKMDYMRCYENGLSPEDIIVERVKL